jgi:hypothetical protein
MAGGASTIFGGKLTMIAAPTIQRRFGFDAACEKHSLALMATAKWFLRCDEDQILCLIADRQLVGFDLRGPGAEKIFPGIWYRSLAAVKDERDGRDMSFSDDATDEAIADIFPKRERLRLAEVKLALCVTSSHLHHLLDGGLLRSVQGTGDRICKAPLITRESVVEFLKARRM